MSKTACWATNKSFDCAWVSWGYGSRYDTCLNWLSLEGLIILSHYDWDYSTRVSCFCLRNDRHEDRVIADKYNLELSANGLYYDLPEELVNKLPLKYQMDASPININHQDGLEKSLEWFVLARERAGKCYRDGYNGVEYKFDWSGSEYADKTPSTRKIKELNPYHYQCIKNISVREEEYYDSMNFREKSRKMREENWGEEMVEEYRQAAELHEKEKELRWQQMKKFL